MTVGAVAAPPPEPAVEAPVEAAPVVSPTPDAPPAAAVTQTAPTNVNVSVRVDSPGDNGSVEQVNVVEVTAPSGHGNRPSVSAGRAAVSGADTASAAPDSRCGTSRPRPSLHPRPRVGTGTGNGIAAMRFLKYRSRRRSGHRTGPGTGIGIAGIQIHYQRIRPAKTRRSINLVLRSIGRSISTSRSASTVRVTTARSTRPKRRRRGDGSGVAADPRRAAGIALALRQSSVDDRRKRSLRWPSFAGVLDEFVADDPGRRCRPREDGCCAVP